MTPSDFEGLPSRNWAFWISYHLLPRRSYQFLTLEMKKATKWKIESSENQMLNSSHDQYFFCLEAWGGRYIMSRKFQRNFYFQWFSAIGCGKKKSIQSSLRLERRIFTTLAETESNGLFCSMTSPLHLLFLQTRTLVYIDMAAGLILRNECSWIFSAGGS